MSQHLIRSRGLNAKVVLPRFLFIKDLSGKRKDRIDAITQALVKHLLVIDFQKMFGCVPFKETIGIATFLPNSKRQKKVLARSLHPSCYDNCHEAADAV